ncbi:hypothetical protein [Marininema halotolerans]|uniref:Uncharacterized protein n=1 Tax=Marininema halotolerans TaxID=1155944 RepID=A0A1I6UN74_9BACL|nr:hypothetical protein [Marininema halotolerans]SFT02848.1 hypothetical protein SAMN05444972_11842 [Marininema halotolerans]
MKYSSLHGHLFVDTDMDTDQLLNLLINKSNGIPGYLQSMSTDSYEIDLSTNDDFDQIKRHTEETDSFLYFRYCAEVDIVEGYLESMYIKEIGELLQSLYSTGFRVVLACEFEEELPNKGFFL